MYLLLIKGYSYFTYSWTEATRIHSIKNIAANKFGSYSEHI